MKKNCLLVTLFLLLLTSCKSQPVVNNKIYAEKQIKRVDGKPDKDALFEGNFLRMIMGITISLIAINHFVELSLTKLILLSIVRLLSREKMLSLF